MYTLGGCCIPRIQTHYHSHTCIPEVVHIYTCTCSMYMYIQNVHVHVHCIHVPNIQGDLHSVTHEVSPGSVDSHLCVCVCVCVCVV